MPSWPSDLPFVIVAPNTVQGPFGSVISSDMDVGPAKRRARQTSGLFRMSGTTPALTAAQRDQFIAFHDATLGQGVLSFDATCPVLCAIKSFRIIGPYTIERTGNAWRVSLDLERSA